MSIKTVSCRYSYLGNSGLGKLDLFNGGDNKRKSWNETPGASKWKAFLMWARVTPAITSSAASVPDIDCFPLSGWLTLPSIISCHLRATSKRGHRNNLRYKRSVSLKLCKDSTIIFGDVIA